MLPFICQVGYSGRSAATLLAVRVAKTEVPSKYAEGPERPEEVRHGIRDSLRRTGARLY
jgi:hypothetical protein